MIKVAIADDHKLVLNGVKDILQLEPNIELVAAVNSGSKLLDVIKNNDIDVVLSDIDMPGLSGIEVLRKVKEDNLTTKIILLSVHDEKAIIQKAFNEGAYGYLLKRSEPEIILDAIEMVFKGKKFFDDEVLKISMSPENDFENSSNTGLVAKLTKREKQIISLIEEGNSNQEVSDRLFISKRTVDTHRNNLMVKLGFTNTVELVKFALKNGLAD
jgi:DNA-binding NarL/FixJ family response regulator